MATTTTSRQTETGSKQSVDAQGKIQKLRDLFADAPELGKKALENVLRELTSDVSQGEWPRVESAGRTGARLGKVSELTIIVPLAPGGAKRLRAFLQLLGGYADAGKVGTVHNMRFVFLDNDTKMLFATAYDGDWHGAAAAADERSDDGAQDQDAGRADAGCSGGRGPEREAGPGHDHERQDPGSRVHVLQLLLHGGRRFLPAMGGP